jgi:N-carbamoyl-L-amino-acid hydrolase
MEPKRLRINGRRFKATVGEMSKIGATPRDGLHRVALSDEDREARDLFVKWLKEIKLAVTIDEMGNIFGKRPGKGKDLAPVLSGSHLDSQPNGGRFDGTLGVIGTLEVLRTLQENDVITERPIVIVNWTNEEGSRFAPALMGSGVWAGKLNRDWIYGRTDIHGKKFEEELKRIRYKGKAAFKKWPVHAYYEYHIEQGPVLERIGKRIGIPEGIVCVHWYDVYLEGTANQVGPTPMEGRNDALCAAAEMILKVNDLPGKMGSDMVATVGEIQNHPNSRNIIPGRVHFTVDIRSWDDALAVRAWEDLKKELKAISDRRGCLIKIEETWRVKHTAFDKKLIKRILKTADRLEYPSHCMLSGAGHDAIYMSQVAPTAMIFVPSIGGRSHVEVEKTKWEDCVAGANVLLHCILESALEK